MYRITSAACITGDFNCDESDPVDILTGDAAWPIVDARSKSESPHYGAGATFTGWHGQFDKIIDYVFVRPDVRVLQHGAVAELWGSKKVSDHNAVVADLLIPSNKQQKDEL